MRKRPPTVRACSIRARKLAKSGKGDTKKGEALAACAATPRRSRPRPKIAPATKSTCRRRAKALQSGKVGRSERSKVAYRLGLCRKPAKRGGAHRMNPAKYTGPRYVNTKQLAGYKRAQALSHGLDGISFSDADNLRRFGITREQYAVLSRAHGDICGMMGGTDGMTLGAVNEWVHYLHPKVVRDHATVAFGNLPVDRANPSASSSKAKVVGAKTMGKTYRRRFLLVQLGPSRLVWVEASGASTIGPIVNRASADAIGVDTDDRGYPLSEEDRWAIVAAFNAYVARRGSAW